MSYPAQQMIRRNHLFQVKLVEKTALTVLLPTHHPDYPRIPPQISESGCRTTFKKSFSTVFAGGRTFRHG
jgi:hypothetical protein